MPERNHRSQLSRIQADIVSCESCQPYDKEDEEVIWCDGDRVSIEHLLDLHRMPESKHEETATRLHCPNCDGSFSLGDEVGIRTSEDRERERVYRDWATRLAPRFADFTAHLARVPLLGATHSIGKRVLRSIAKFPHASLDLKDNWWRARVIGANARPDISELGPPPASECKNEGRFNHVGQRVLYVASSIEVAAAEAIRQDEGVAWVMAWRVGVRGPMLDLASHFDESALHDDASYLAAGLSYIRPHLAEASEGPWKPEYFVSRFIADAARAAGFKGLRYPSTRFLGDCLVLFDWDDAAVTPVGEPRQIEWNRKAAEAALPF